ncbi:MAG TPA: MDR family MFS transporter [Beutenbergiaceae bacterium]|nr:MDR family MFS transporter [Beutenbergiaceae bacterium]
MTSVRAKREQGTTPTASSAGLIIAVMVIAAFVMILNETIVSIALPQLATTLEVSTSTIQWLISGFLLTMAVVIPMTGFLLNKFSPRTMFLAAVGSFTVGTLVCAAAPNFAGLLAGRVVQASGTAVMIPLVMTSVMQLIPAERRGAMMGTISIVIGVAPAIGPTTGGAILALLGWRWMFWLVFALAVVLFALGAARLHVPAKKEPSTLPAGSVALSAGGFASLLYGLSTLGQPGALVPPWACLLVSAVLLTLFVLRQRTLQQAGTPLLDLRTLTYPRYRTGLLLSLVVFMALLGAGAILLPIYLQGVLGHDPFTAGLALLPGGLTMAAISRPAGTWYDRLGARKLVIPGAMGMAASLWGLALVGGAAPLALVIGIHMALMLSLGLMMTPIMADSLGTLPDPLHSHGSALLATLQQVAGALGSAVFVTVATLMSVNAASGPPDGDGIRAGFAVAGMIALVGVVMSFRVKAPEPRRLP